MWVLNRPNHENLIMKFFQVAEFDSPGNLLNDDASYFSQIVSETNIAAELRQRAKNK